MPAVESFDVVIIGGGPAGVSCSLELQDHSVKHCLLERGHELGGQLPQITNKIRNLAGLTFKNGTVLQNALIRTANELNLPCRLNDEVIACDLNKKTIKTKHASLVAKTLVIAAGTRMRKMVVEKGTHLASQVIYRIDEQAGNLDGQAAVVVGKDDDAVSAALWLAKRSTQVIIINQSASFEARPNLLAEIKKKRNIEVRLNTKVRALLGDNRINGITIQNLLTDEVSELPTSFVAARVGWTGNCEMFEGQIDITEDRYIAVDQFMQTSKSGVFAVGDIASPSYRRISSAAGQGITAARAIMDYLACCD